MWGTTRLRALEMQTLFDFIVAKKHWLLLLLLQAFSLSLFFGDGLYRQGLSLYVSSYVTGYLNEQISTIYSYVNLQKRNEELMMQNARLEQELILLRRYITDAQANQTLPEGIALQAQDEQTSYATARIINTKNVNGNVYYIVNRGRQHGLKPDMPVMSARGVVGAVLEVAERYSVVVPIINSKTKLSCMVKGKSYQGHVSTQGYNLPVYFSGVSLQADVQEGDTIVTSGYSYLYPEGLMVGTIEQKDSKGAIGADAAFAAYRLRLHTEFDKLRHVYILLVEPMSEAKVLADSVLKEDEP